MTWVKVDDKANEHAKQLAAGGEACWLWACGLMYCNRQSKKTGFIPDVQVKALYADYSAAHAHRLAARLVVAGLWHKVDGGFQVHDYGDYQPKGGGQVDPNLSAKRAAAGSKGGLQSGEARKQNEANSRSKTKQTVEASFALGVEAIPPRARAGADARRVGSGSDPDPEGSAEGVAPETGFDLALRVWSELWRKEYKRDYQLPFDLSQGGDERVLQRVGQMAIERGAAAERVLRHKVSAYLASTDKFYAAKDHPLRFLERDWNAWGEPKGKPSGVQKAAMPLDPPLSTERIAERAGGILSSLGVAK